jgi:nicotinamide-nucleotide amidase
MFVNKVVPMLRALDKGSSVIKTRTLKIAGLPELLVNNRIKDALSLSGKTTAGIYVSLGTVEVKITSKDKTVKIADKNIEKVERVVRDRLGDNVYGADDDTMESVVAKLLEKKRKTISLAESCTGGLVSSRLTNIRGSSAYFKNCIVAYANSIKEDLLKVPAELIAEAGAVSREVAYVMAKHIREISGTDIGIGITGIAGPGGATATKPVGLVYISVNYEGEAVTKEFRFSGSRQDVKWLSSCAALDLVRHKLLGNKI